MRQGCSSHPKRFYLSGQSTFGNRGCEAIVRSTVALLREHLGEVEVLVPSSDIERDKAQWPDFAAHGVSFVPAYSPWFTRWWIYLQRLPLPVLKRAGWPFRMPRQLVDTLKSVDLVLSVGGDNYSLDYYLPSFYMGLDNAAMELGTPVVLWGASVGPFDKEPHFLPAIRRHLGRMKLITARESVTVDYLGKLGLTNVESVTDPAFTLVPETVDLGGFWPKESRNGVLGLNLSPLIESYRPSDEPPDQMISEVADFVRSAIEDHGLSVVLVPHVVPLDGSTKGNDAHYLSRILTRLEDMDGRVTLMNSQLNAAKTKYVISKCRFFIGARTHATIASLSSGVPTISIAYSTKARGINRDLFGHTYYVMETPMVSRESLKMGLSRLINEEAMIRSMLVERIPLWQQRAATGVEKLLCMRPGGTDSEV